VFHRSLRTATAALPLAGVLLAAGIAGPAFTGLGTAQGLAFLAVAVASIGLAVAVLRGARWAVATGAVLLGAQLGAVVGTIRELTGGIAASKADILRQLDVSPIAGRLVNLAYSTASVTLSCWLAQRWLRARRLRPNDSDRRIDSAEY
jgi:uncharacterized ion transporter superfamily protein YfcC